MSTNSIALSEEEKWQVEGDVRTLKEAQMIKRDEVRHDKAMALMNDEMGDMSSCMEEAARKMFPNTNFKRGNQQ